ncbi:MAG TPA: hypothetical protein VNS09_02685 [Solirubrobacter sp.]|nr:hypothetical protein [Solirubrobacter sp.]
MSREVRIQCGPLDGVISALLDFDSDAVRAGLGELLARPDLSGDVHLTDARHGEFRASVTLNHGRGTLRARFASAYADQDGGCELTLTTDQSFLAETLRQLGGDWSV